MKFSACTKTGCVLKRSGMKFFSLHKYGLCIEKRWSENEEVVHCD